MKRNFERTSYAVAFVDRLWRVLFKSPNRDLDVLLKKIEAAERKVGHAFWLDTADCNAQDTCENCIRSDAVRHWVNEWRATVGLPALIP